MLLKGWRIRRHRALWRDRGRALRTLESFAQTEERGGADLEAAAARVRDPELRRHFELHARDELRHAQLFRARAAGLRAEVAGESEGSLVRVLHDARADHGFPSATSIDALGEVAFVALLHVAELRAAATFEEHRAALEAADPLHGVLDEILADEKYHCAYTARALERWSSVGRRAEVEAALRTARANRHATSWRRLGVRSASGLSVLAMVLFYWTVFPLLGLWARRRVGRTAWWAASSPERGMP
jgi:hypothetical protein